jgi:2-oxoisovalerate dehydrogenase E2 component (dihydrolipoyl transacylase)
LSVATYSFRLPDIGEGVAEAEIVAWHVKIGDIIEEDQPIADMMTDKATIEMTSPVSGTVTALAGDVGDVIAIGSTLVTFDTGGEPEIVPPAEVEESRSVQAASSEADKHPSRTIPEEKDVPSPALGKLEPSLDTNGKTELAATTAAGANHGKVLTSPAVRARAKDLGIDLAQVKPSAEGRIRHADLDAYLSYNAGQGYGVRSPRRPDEAVKVVGMRRRIAENMAASKRHIPHFTYVEEIDVTDLEAMRVALNDNRGNRPKLTMLPFLIVAIAKTLPDFPMINARYDDEAGVVTRHGALHLGMATQTDAGLMVPVIRDAQDRNVWQLATEITRLAEAARSGKAKSEELSGSTLTLTSLGPLGGIVTTPVINRPEVAIIGPNRIIERPVFRGKEIVAAKLMNLSISCDHRVVDGWDAANFVQALKRLLETPALLFV